MSGHGTTGEVQTVSKDFVRNNPSKRLALPLLSVFALLGWPKLFLMMSAASQPRRFGVASGTTNTGNTQPPAPDQAASSFAEDLIRRGRIAVQEEDIGDAPIIPSAYTTHEIRPTAGALEMRRTRFDCGFGTQADRPGRRFFSGAPTVLRSLFQYAGLIEPRSGALWRARRCPLPQFHG
jgi:hypothetical protein